MKKYLEAGKIINKRGLRGEVKVESYCDSASILCSIGTLYYDEDGKRSVKVICAKEYKGFAYLTLDGVKSAEDADLIRNKILYADRNDIPIDEDSYFIDDLIGLSVIDADSGKCYGKVTDVFNRGASDIYTVTQNGKDYYLPAVDEFIVETDTQKGIFVRPIPGIFDDAEQV